jgi:hypothetical protein
MVKGKYRHRSTHRVVRELLLASQRAEQRLSAVWYFHPWAWVTRSWASGYMGNSQDCLHELAYRYRGVLMEDLRLKGVTSRDDVQGSLGQMWRSFYGSTYGLSDEFEFAPLLWRSVQETAPGVNAQVKRKFMLRQFVEDVPRRKGRDTLRRLAFEREHGAPAATVEDLAKLRNAYQPLHQVMVRFGPQLESMTDGVFTIETLNALVPPFTEYHSWLFENDDDTTP